MDRPPLITRAAAAWRTLLRGAATAPAMTTDTVPLSPSGPFSPPPGGYNSGVTFSPLKDYREVRPTDRRDAVKVSRYLRAKLGLVKALFENTARYTLGRGLVPSSSCVDEEWARRADDYFQTVTATKEFDVREDLTFYGMQRLVLPDVMCDGDCGVAKVRADNGRPQLQIFPTESIGNALGEAIYDAMGTWRDGILRNAAGKAIRFRVLKEMRPGQPGGARKFYDYRAADFLHVGRTDRINANRPMPWLYHGDGCALQILDLNTLEMETRKLQTFFAGAIETETGAPPASLEDFITRETETVGDTAADGTASTKTVDRNFINLHGAANLMTLARGEKANFFKDGRDATSYTEFVQYMITDIALGFGVPREFVWGLAALSGPSARLVLQQADWFFADAAEMLVSDFCQPVWESVIADAMNRRLLPVPAAGTNWRAVSWQGPGSMTIDKGRDGKLYLDLVRSGMGTRSAWFEMTGRDGRTEMRKAIEEIRWAMDECDRRGVPYSLFFGPEVADALARGASAEDIADEVRRQQQDEGEG